MNKDNKLEKYKNAFERITEQFLNGLPEREDEIKDLGRRVSESSSCTPNELHEIVQKTHKLAGSSATFNFPNVASVAKQIEQTCNFWISSEPKKCEKQKQQLSILITKLVKEIDDMKLGRKSKTLDDLSLISNVVSRDHTLLLVEDDPDQAQHLAMGLNIFGFVVHIVSSHKDISSAIELHKPKAIILDLEFEEGRLVGAEALQKLRKEALVQDIPVVVLSVHDDFDARLSSLRAGCECFMTKPVDLSEIVQVLDGLSNEVETLAPRVLVVDDDESVLKFLQLTLEDAGMMVSTLSNPEEIFSQLNKFNPELLLCDLWMPVCNGIELANIIRQKEEYAGLPIVFLSGELDEKKQLEAMSKGGDDFLIKPIDAEVLVSKINSKISRFRVLRNKISCDGLTGTLNHTALTDRIENELIRARRQVTPVCFALLDIDDFKRINDTYGHGAGDKALKSLSNLLHNWLRRSDVIGRMGGDEFGIILSDTPIKSAIETMSRIVEAVRITPLSYQGSEFNITISCGVSESFAHPSKLGLLESADQALYQSKVMGKNTVTSLDAIEADNIVVGEATEIEEIAQEQVLSPQSGANIDNKSILIVDDDPDICKVLKFYAENCGYRAETISDPLDFPSVYRESFDLIVLDLQMPGYDGVELIRFLGENRSKAAIVIISGFDQEILSAAKGLASNLGLNILGALQKPVDKDKLVAILNSVVRKSDVKENFVNKNLQNNNMPELEDLKQALKNNQITSFYQPKVSLTERKIIGVEALARWITPQFGFVPPDYFIALAETGGLIDELTRQMFSNVINDFDTWPKAMSEIGIAINLSEMSLSDLDLPSKISGLIEDAPFSSNQIILEITETTLGVSATSVLDVLTRLRLRGFKIAIDDFGTGHSSLARLDQLPFNELKIDRSFVTNATQDETSYIIIKNTIELAHSLNLRVVAEGAETKEQIDLLAGLKCDVVQGYGISKPLPSSDLIEFFKDYSK